MQFCPSGPVYPRLQVQLVRMLLPSPEYVWCGQVVHVDSEISPVSVEYVPCEHNEHTDEPLTVLYVPATHALHSCPSGPVYPRLQVQSVILLLPSPEYVCPGQLVHVTFEISASSVEYFPREHSKHTDEPLTSLYVPATHALHSCPSGPVYPLLQVQLMRMLLPAPEYV